MKVLRRIQTLVAAYVCFWGLWAGPAFSQSTCVVTTNLDSGTGSLREAINCANADPDFSTITFNIPGSGLITTYSDLPTISSPLLLDGTSQAGYTSTKNPLIHILADNSNGAPAGLVLGGNSQGSEIRGLYISNFISFGIWVQVNYVTISHNVFNYFRSTGINAVTGIGFQDGGSYSKVFGNIFGTDFSGADLTYNHADQNDVGVYVYAMYGVAVHDIQIGGVNPGEANKFAYLMDGVVLNSGALVYNISLSGNEFLAIEEAGLYQFPGTNQNRSLPSIQSCANYLVQGNALPSDKIEIYTGNASGQNANYVGSAIANSTTGIWSFDLTTLAKPLPLGSTVLASATDAQGNTSLFSLSCLLTCTAVSQTSAPKSICQGASVLLGSDNLLNGLLAYYPFNGNAEDVSGNGKGGTLVGNPTPVPDRFGNSDGAFALDGTNYIQTSLASLAGSELTISYWIKGYSSQYAVVQQKGADMIGAGANAMQILSNDGGIPGGLSQGTAGQLYDESWHHIAFTWKQNTANGFKTYLDGTLLSQRTSTDVPLPAIRAFVMLGKSEDGFYTGYLDDVAMYNRALSAQEVTALAQEYTWTGAGLVNVQSSSAGALTFGTPLENTNYWLAGPCINGSAFQYTLPVTVNPNVLTNLPDVSTCAVNEVLLPATPSLTNGLLAYFPFNGDPADKSGNSATGTISGTLSPATDRFGNATGAFHFDGTAYVQTDITSLAGSALTISYWYQGNQGINFAVGQFNGGDMVMSTWHGVHMLTNDGSVDESQALSPGIPSIMYDGNWHHFVVTWQQNQVNGFRSYLDGKLMDQRNSGNTPIADLSTPLMFGYCFWGDHLKGNLDDIAIYKRALTTQEVETLFYPFTWTQNATSSQAGSLLLVPPVASKLYTVSASNFAYYSPSTSLNCFQYNMKLAPCLNTDLSYYVLKSKPEASVVELPNNQLKFYFKERYVEGTFNIKVYDYEATMWRD